MEQNENQDSIRERIRAYAFDLKLPLVRRDIDLLIQQGLDERWNLWMFTAELLRQEKENRSENQRRHRIKNAAFPQLRYLNEIDTDALPPEARKALPNLETLDFIKEGRNLILYGNPGTGKTHLATALGIAACNAGYSVLFTSVPSAGAPREHGLAMLGTRVTFVSRRKSPKARQGLRSWTPLGGRLKSVPLFSPIPPATLCVAPPRKGKRH